MTTVSRFVLAQRAMFAAPAHALVETLVASLREHYGVTAAELLIADYTQAVLRPVLDPDGELPVTGTEAGRAYAEQRVITRDTQILLPVTARGDRIGVLRLERPEPFDVEAEDELVDLTVALAHDLRAADEITGRYRAARRRDRLTLAAEIQWHLLPGRSVTRKEYVLAGQLEPAYAVRGDNFDWSSEADHLIVSVTNGFGEGVEAALLTSLAVNAMRNARFAGASLADQARLADEAVYAAHRGKQHVSTLLLRFDVATGLVSAVDAGSPMLMRLRGDRVEELPLDAQLPLGMFESTAYEEQTFQILPGDRLFILSDGVHDARYEGLTYREEGRLRQTISATRRLPPGEAIRAVLGDHAVFRRSLPHDDDCAVVCLDWRRTATPDEPEMGLAGVAVATTRPLR
ncbi:phosphatase [Virgisporangium aliadipatigenens]|uniref:Phosphatase n=1 Tax=Virgisporangium aliadipatigenens TaxID=741659 RepID=A0A8J3YSP5_9ACTN|nr:PP2C family protein-serine/threonine phosphatase [Virgisporangium aliadipatigenens]GIJ49116.1 phosphatase [Virgisporangium aliadipatigenens]